MPAVALCSAHTQRVDPATADPGRAPRGPLVSEHSHLLLELPSFGFSNSGKLAQGVEVKVTASASPPVKTASQPLYRPLAL